MVGGQHPEVDHPVTEFTVTPKDITIRANEVHEIDLVADGRAEFPVQYELVTTDISVDHSKRIRDVEIFPGRCGWSFPARNYCDRRAGRDG